MTGDSRRIGTIAHINGYDVLMFGDTVHVMKDEVIVTAQTARGLEAFLVKARDLRIGWAMFDDFEVIYLYDKADAYFGYAVNLQIDAFSEWGYAPFGGEMNQ